MNTILSRKTAYIGAGAGLVLFAIFGLLPGSLLGGAMGINIAGWLFGLPLHPGIVATGHCTRIHACRSFGVRYRDGNSHIDRRLAHG